MACAGPVPYYGAGFHVRSARVVTERTDPYPWRPEAVRQLREQGRHDEAEAILNAPLVWQPEEKSLDQWLALAAYLVRTARGATPVVASDAVSDADDDLPEE